MIRHKELTAMGPVGWLAILFLLATIGTAVTFGFFSLFYFAIIMAPLNLIILIVLSAGMSNAPASNPAH